MEMQTNSSVRLTAVGIEHYLDQVQVQAKQAPVTSINAHEILDPSEQDFAAKIDPEQPKLNHGDMVFFKFSGKYIVLVGRETARRALADGQGVLRGKLVSKQALKRCRIDSGATPVARPVQVETKRPAKVDFRNTPTFKTPVEQVRAIAKPLPAVVPAEQVKEIFKGVEEMKTRNQEASVTPSSQYSEEDKLTPDQQERVRRAKEQHAKDNAAGTVTFAEPDWREKFSAKYGRFPGSPNVKPNPDKQNRKTPNSSFSGAHVSAGKPMFDKRPRPSIAEIGGYSNKPKADSVGRARFNPSDVNPEIEPGQDRPMQEFGQVDRILTDVRPGGGPRRPSQFGGGRRRSTH
ncbi:MAG: hypothetical protein P4L77_11265 [Sulfuriferula sp.]|nr:hypothetical protein [Sulfuriferula sp.]